MRNILSVTLLLGLVSCGAEEDHDPIMETFLKSDTCPTGGARLVKYVLSFDEVGELTADKKIILEVCNGVKGDQGIQGIAGKDGEDGKDGVDGKDGADGRDGAHGRNGVDGED